MAEEFYGEIDEKFVDSEKLKIARETFDFCVRNYGTAGRNLRLRWLNRDRVDYAVARMKEAIHELFGGKRPDAVEHNYFESEQIDGVVSTRFSEPEKPGPIFISAETPIEKIGRTVGHEYYHARFSPPCLGGFGKEQDEREAIRFGKRIEKEMAAEKAREADERWRARYRETMNSK